MKKAGIINAQVAGVVAKMGHTDTLGIVDAGFPISAETKRIDLSVECGLPSFLDVLDNVLTELVVEEVILAREIKEKNKELYQSICERFGNIKITIVTHEELKRMSRDCSAVIRTGECKPFANIILHSGVTF